MPDHVEVDLDDPRRIAWEEYRQSEDYPNVRRWAVHGDNVDGSLWSSFVAGFEAASKSS